MASLIGRSLRTIIRPIVYNQPKQLSAPLSNTTLRFFASATEPESKEKFEKLVKNNKVVVFMKGVPESPKCGFSNAVVQILRMHAVPYESHDVLSDESIRQGVKDFTNWPTIPQIFINGEFIGGCDILLQMHQNGELVEELEKVGIRSALLDQQKEEGEQKDSKDEKK